MHTYMKDSENEDHLKMVAVLAQIPVPYVPGGWKLHQVIQR